MSFRTGIATTRRVLRGSQNRAVDSLCGDALQESSPLRWLAVDALAKRKSPAGKQKVLESFRSLNDLERSVISNVATDFRPLLEESLESNDPQRAEQACRFISYYQFTPLLPEVVRQARTGKHKYEDGLTATVLQLARQIYEQAAIYRDDRSQRDPIFERRAAVAELGIAIEHFQDHQRFELAEAFMLLAPSDNGILSRVLTDKTHPAHQTLLHTLATSPSHTALEAVARMLGDARTPDELLQLAAARHDVPFLNFLGTHFPSPLSRRATENLGRVRSLEWLNYAKTTALECNDTARVTLLEMAQASRAPRIQVFEFARRVLECGESASRVKACDILGRVNVPRSTKTLRSLAEDNDEAVAVQAAAKLYERGFIESRQQLISAIGHSDPLLQQTARGALRRTTFANYLASFDALDLEEQISEGRAVAAIDDSSLELLQVEFYAATVDRRLRAVKMARAMGVVEQLVERLVVLAKDNDVAVRVEAIQALEGSDNPAVREVIFEASSDAHGMVRRTAERAMADWKQPFDPDLDVVDFGSNSIVEDTK